MKFKSHINNCDAYGVLKRHCHMGQEEYMYAVDLFSKWKNCVETAFLLNCCAQW